MPEQILILETIFNSWMVNPPKDETVNKKIAWEIRSVQLGRQTFSTSFRTNAQDLNPTTPDASYPWKNILWNMVGFLFGF